MTARVAADGTVRFESVPAFAYALDRIAPTRTWGPVTVDIAYGGAFYAFLSADSIGLDLRSSPMRAIVDAGEEIAEAAAKAVPIEHPDEPDLAFLYGTILTDGGNGADRPSRNVCIFAGRQIDRSPTGSGVTARMALQMARREARLGDERRFESCTGDVFSGRIVREASPVGGRKSVIVEVGGRAHQTGEARFRFDDDDPLREGFSLASEACCQRSRRCHPERSEGPSSSKVPRCARDDSVSYRRRVKRCGRAAAPGRGRRKGRSSPRRRPTGAAGRSGRACPVLRRWRDAL